MADRDNEANVFPSRLDTAFWSDLFDIHVAPLAIVDTSYRIVRANRALAQALGGGPEELAGRLCYEVFHDDVCPVGACPHARLLDDGCAHASELKLERLGGHFCVSVTPLFDTAGRLRGSLHIAQNVSAYKQLEEQLRAARDTLAARAEARAAELRRHLQFEELLVSVALRLGPSLSERESKRVVQSCVTQIAEAGGFDRCVFWRVSGDRAQAVARHVATEGLPPLPDETSAKQDPWLFAALEGSGICADDGGAGQRWVVSLPSEWAGDQTFVLLADVRPAGDGADPFLSGERLQLLCRLMGDALLRQAGIRETQRLREALARLEQLARLGQLSAALAHELNQPLAATLCNAQAAARLLCQEPPDLPEACSALDDIIASARRAGDVMRQTRALFKGGAERMSPVELRALVGAALKLLEDDISCAGAEIVREDAADVPAVLADDVQMQQVLINLMRNALDAVSDKVEGQRVITVSTRKAEDGGALMTVEDNGRGLPDDDLELIFLPLQTSKRHGMGIGLTICRQILAHLGGEIRAERVPSGGARFVVSLPAITA